MLTNHQLFITKSVLEEVLQNQTDMESKIYLVMELYMSGCSHMHSKPKCSFASKDVAELYAKEGNESDEGKEFVKRYDYEEVEFKFFIHEVTHNL
jgi:hypothetical protein